MSSSSGSTQQIRMQSPGGSGGVDQRKRKRMESNRESARRSRERKQKHLDDLVSQVGHLEKENKHLNATIHGTTHELVNVDAENSVLRAQVTELTRRLESLDEILRNMSNTAPVVADADPGRFDLQAANSCGDSDFDAVQIGCDGFLINPWMNMLYHHNQPIVAAADAFQYY